MAESKASFIVNAITRAGIADDLNGQIGDGTAKVLTPDDDRLTDDFCRWYAERLGELNEEDDEGFCALAVVALAKLALPVPRDSAADADSPWERAKRAAREE